MIRPTTIFILLMTAALAPTGGQELSVNGQRLTPAGLTRQALANNPELNSYAAEVAAARASLKTAGTIRNPEISTQFGYKNVQEGSGTGLTPPTPGAPANTPKVWL